MEWMGYRALSLYFRCRTSCTG